MRSSICLTVIYKDVYQIKKKRFFRVHETELRQSMEIISKAASYVSRKLVYTEDVEMKYSKSLLSTWEIHHRPRIAILQRAGKKYQD